MHCSHPSPGDRRTHRASPLRRIPQPLRFARPGRLIGGTLGTMKGSQGLIDPVLVGRDIELGILGALLDRAATGTFGALIVRGDAGVGKTALIQQACAVLDASALVLSGGGLPLGSLSVPFLALQSALRGMPPHTGEALPRMLASGDSAPHVPVVFDAWLDELCRDRLVDEFTHLESVAQDRHVQPGGSGPPGDARQCATFSRSVTRCRPKRMQRRRAGRRSGAGRPGLTSPAPAGRGG